MKHEHLLGCLFALLLLIGPGTALALDTSLCSKDGVTEVPPFAEGYDKDGCLVVNSGNGDPPVRFQFRKFHGPSPGFSQGVTVRTTKYPGRGYDMANVEYGRCKSKNNSPPEACTMVLWDIDIDGYSDPKSQGQDLLKISEPYKYVLIKDVKLRNQIKCQGAAWSWKFPDASSNPRMLA